MSLRFHPSGPTVPAPGAARFATTLSWLWLGLVRCAWVAFALLLLIVCLRGLPGLSTLPRPLDITAWDLGFLGVPAGQRDTALLVIRSIFYFLLPLAGLALSALIFWRRSHDWLALLVAIMLMTWVPVRTGLASFALNLSVIEWLRDVMVLTATASLVFALFLFPNGRFVPRWAWPLPVAFVAAFLLQGGGAAQLQQLVPYLFVATLIAGVLSQLYRYLRLTTATERQQVRWAMFGLCVAVLTEVASVVVDELRQLVRLNVQLSYTLFVAAKILAVITPLSLLLVPLTLSLAILRSQLWTITFIVNRTLVYGALTALLLGLYASSVMLWQRLFRMLTGQNHELAVILSTLVIAILFHPLRRQLQTFIDQRFYRCPYDAAQVLAAFRATTRNEVDLNRLSDDLVMVVQETMQPAQVSLWMRPQQPVVPNAPDHLLLSDTAQLSRPHTTGD